VKDEVLSQLSQVKNFTVESSIDEMRIHCKYGLHKNEKTGELDLSATGCKVRAADENSHRPLEENTIRAYG
jgi:hypothetical protein